MTTSATPSAANHVDSIDEVELWGTYWAYLRHHQRQVTVTWTGRALVQVAFWIGFGTRAQLVRFQRIAATKLRRRKPAPRHPGVVIDAPAPTRDQVVKALELGLAGEQSDRRES